MSVDLASGTVLDGKYRIERKLGKGGMGTVYLATHLGTTRTVALKVIVPHLAAHREFFARFQREAEAAGRLRHPNVVNVTDFGVAAAVEGAGGAGGAGGTAAIAYLVMEYLDGRTLAEHLAGEPKPPIEFVVDVVDQVALALDAAHAIGIVHRDLKPENIWLESNRRGGYNVKVLDFGVAKLADPRADGAAPELALAPPGLPQTPGGGPVDPDISSLATIVNAPESTDTVAHAPEAVPTVVHAPDAVPTALHPPGSTRSQTAFGNGYETVAGSLVGTPAYMSPEQCRGEAVDRRSDVYSLAVIAYQMLSGKVPFLAGTPPETIRMQISAAPPPLEVHAPAVPAGLAAVVTQGLAKAAAQRPASAGIFAARVRVGAEGESRTLRQSKDIVNSHIGMFALLVASAFVLPAAALVALRGLLLATYPLLDLPRPLVVAVSLAVSAGFLLLGAQFYDALCMLALRQFIERGRYRLDRGRLLREYLGLLPRLLATKLRAMARLFPSHGPTDQLWPVVVVAEGLSGQRALRRSAELAGPIRPLAGAAFVRQLAPALSAAAVFSAMFTLMGRETLNEFARALATNGWLGWFVMLYPMMLAGLYMAYGPGRCLLYWTARQCLGEADPPELPDIGRQRRSASGRPSQATIAWMVFPVVLLALTAFGLVRLARPSASAELEEAVREGRLHAATRLLDAKTPVDETDFGGATPLMEAVNARQRAVVELLLARGADVDARDQREVTPLGIAVRRGDADIARLLLEHGADPNAADERGRTPLMVATMRGDAELAALLLDAGADPSRRDRERKSALDFARDERNAAIEALLTGPGGAPPA